MGEEAAILQALAIPVLVGQEDEAAEHLVGEKPNMLRQLDMPPVQDAL